MTINVNKFISSSGYCSRRQADRLIKEGVVFLNGKKAVPTDKINDSDTVEISEADSATSRGASGQLPFDKESAPPTNYHNHSNRKVISHTKPKHIYLAFNKPLGVISTSDKDSKNNIMDYIKIPDRVFPVGRLDVKSEGLILLTNDGELTQQILKEKTVEKEYAVNVDKNIDEAFLNHLRSGVMMDGRKTLPAKAELLSERSFKIIIVEGRKRQIRRMCEMFHINVTKLIRTRIGQIELKDIPVGKYIEIDKKEIFNLLKLV